MFVVKVTFSIEDKSLIDDVVALKVPGLDAERHLVIMHAAEDTGAADK